MSETKTISLVIGGGGFIGSHLCLLLLKAGHIVISVDKQFPHLFKMPISDSFYSIGADLTKSDNDDEKKILNKISCVFDKIKWSLKEKKYASVKFNLFNLACESNTMNNSYEDHVEGNRSVINFVNKFPYFIYDYGIFRIHDGQSLNSPSLDSYSTILSSSASIYGNASDDNKEPFKEGRTPSPESIYAWSKLESEYLLSKNSIINDVHGTFRNVKFNHKIFRFFNVFGELESHKIAITPNGEIQTYQSKVFQMREAAKYGRESVLFGSGDEKRDFISVDTVCDVLTNHDKKEPGIYNLGSGRATSFNEVKEILLTKYPKAKFIYKECPYPFFQKYTCADMSKSPEIIPEVEFQKLRHFLLA